MLLAVIGGCRSTDTPPPREQPSPETAEDLDVTPPRPRLVMPEVEDTDSGEVAPPTTAPAEAPAAPPPLTEGREQLAVRARSMLGGALETVEDGRLAVLVTDRYGREILSHGADAPVLPASTVKVVTAAAVLSTLGPDARLTTRVETTAPITEDGTVHGDLVMVGGGDPVLATERYERWVYPDRPRTPLEELADTIVAAGVRRVDGRLIGTAEGYPGPTHPEGWPERYFRDLDARYHGGLTVDAGLTTQLSYPEADDEDAGDPGTREDEAAPDGDGATVAEESTAEGGEVEASIDDRGPPRVRLEHAVDPAAHATRELLRLLTARGVEVSGGAVTSEAGPSTVGLLATVSSPPIEELLRFAVRRSDNHIMDALFRTVALVRTGEGSWAAGDRALRQVLDRYGVDHRGAVFADGSGLSRDNRVTARLLVDLDRGMRSSRHRSTWSSLMAVMGESGTLTSRMAGTAAAGRFVGKTGTLRDVTGLAGSVLGLNGQARYHLVVIANGPWDTASTARVLADQLVLLLAAEVRGCEVDDADGDPGVLGLPPLAVAC